MAEAPGQTWKTLLRGCNSAADAMVVQSQSEARTMPFLPAHDPANFLNFIQCGAATETPVVFLHAVGLDLTWLGPQVEAASARHRVVAFDLLGHGASSRPARGYSLEELACDLVAVIRGVGASSAHVVGHSVGGMIAQVLAVQQPEMVRSLTLIATAPSFSEAARKAIRQRGQVTRSNGMGAVLQATIERWFTPEFAARRPDVIDRCIKTLLSDSKEVHAAMWEGIARHDASARLGALRCPALVVAGEQDTSTPPQVARELAAMIPGAQFEIIPAAAHLAPVEAPELVNDQLLKFLDAL
jgi:3-oxoadipate enol-lactonase